MEKQVKDSSTFEKEKVRLKFDKVKDNRIVQSAQKNSAELLLAARFGLWRIV